MKILRFKVQASKQSEDHPGWENIILQTHSSSLATILSFYVSFFYINLDSNKAVPFLKDITHRYNSYRLGSSFIRSELYYEDSMKIEKIWEQVTPPNRKCIIEWVKTFGATESSVPIHNAKLILAGLWPLGVAIAEKHFANYYSIQQIRLVEDICCYLILGKACTIHHPVVISTLSHYRVEPADEKEDYTSKNEVFKSLDFEKFKSGTAPIEYVQTCVEHALAVLKEWLLTNSSLIEDNMDYSSEVFGISRLQAYPIFNFEEFSEHVGSIESAKFIILADKRCSGVFSTIYKNSKKTLKEPVIRSSRRSRYGRGRSSYKSQQKMRRYETNLDAQKELEGYDWSKLKPEPWMIKYIAPECIQTLEKLFKLLSKPEVVLPSEEVGKNLIQYVRVLSGKTLRIKMMDQTLTKEQYDRLEYKDVVKCIKALSTEEVFSLFRDCLDTQFKKMFLSAKLFALYRKSPFGKVSENDATRSLVKEDEYLPTVLDNVAKNWDPSTVPWQEYIRPMLPGSGETAVEDLVTPHESEDPTELEKSLKAFMSYGHGVDFKIEKVWNIAPKESVRKYLTENLNNPLLKVIENGFHGTHTSAAGAIIMSGFKLKGTMKTARSMGDVLYIAPNLDKSLQYIGTNKGGHGRDDAKGIIFHGDLAIMGGAARDANNISDTDVCNWTLTPAGRFATQEIGLVDANVQFILKKAYLLTRTRLDYSGNSSTVEERTKFKQGIPVTEYVQKNPEVLKETPKSNLTKFQQLLNMDKKKKLKIRIPERVEDPGSIVVQDMTRKRRKKNSQDSITQLDTTKQKTNNLAGISVCWTGTTQAKIKKLILENGGRAVNTVQPGLTYLVLKDPKNSQRPRAIKARRLGIPLIDVSEIRRILLNKGAIE
jgi:hypothetical protein